MPVGFLQKQSQNITKTDSNVKSTLAALYHFSKMNSLPSSGPKKKAKNSVSALEIDHKYTILISFFLIGFFSGDSNIQPMVYQENINSSMTNHLSEVKSYVNKKLSSEKLRDFPRRKPFGFKSNLQPYNSQVKPTSSLPKKMVNTPSKEEPINDINRVNNEKLPKIPLKYRGISPTQCPDDKGYFLSNQPIPYSTQPTQANEEIKVGNSRPGSHKKDNQPLFEMPSDFLNLEEHNQEGANTSTYRTRDPRQAMSQRPEHHQKPIKVTRGPSTPQARTNGQSFKFVAMVPKAKPIQNQQKWKSVLSDDEKKHYGDRFIDGYEKVDFLGR